MLDKPVVVPEPEGKRGLQQHKCCVQSSVVWCNSASLQAEAGMGAGCRRTDDFASADKDDRSSLRLGTTIRAVLTLGAVKSQATCCMLQHGLGARHLSAGF